MSPIDAIFILGSCFLSPKLSIYASTADELKKVIKSTSFILSSISATITFSVLNILVLTKFLFNFSDHSSVLVGEISDVTNKILSPSSVKLTLSSANF